MSTTPGGQRSRRNSLPHPAISSVDLFFPLHSLTAFCSQQKPINPRPSPGGNSTNYVLTTTAIIGQAISGLPECNRNTKDNGARNGGVLAGVPRLPKKTLPSSWKARPVQHPEDPENTALLEGFIIQALRLIHADAPHRFSVRALNSQPRCSTRALQIVSSSSQAISTHRILATSFCLRMHSSAGASRASSSRSYRFKRRRLFEKSCNAKQTHLSSRKKSACSSGKTAI